MAAEVWQFLLAILGFFVVAVSWLFVVYLPGRTPERWEDQRPGRGRGKTAAPTGRGCPEGPSKPES